MYKSIHPGVIIDDGISLLKTIESDKTGLRLLKSNPENHGDIGQDAIDLSTQTVNSETSGATADFSIAFGKNTTANSLYSTVLGISNLGLNDTILEVGIGTNAVPANALEVYQDGKIIAPELTPEMINDTAPSNDKTLITKEWIESIKTEYVVSDPIIGGTGSVKVGNLVKITQDDYDLLVSNTAINPDTFYAII